MGLVLRNIKLVGKNMLIAEGRIIGIDDDRFARRLEKVYKKNYKEFVIDLTNVDFIDSHGIGIIVYYHTLMEKDGNRLIILNRDRNPLKYITRLFELTNLDKVLNVLIYLDQLIEEI